MDLGDTLPFRTDFYDEDGGVLADPASVTLTITLPDGTEVAGTVTNPAVGKYACDYATSSSSPAGRYVGRWLGTFPGGAPAAYVETFDVGDSLVTVDEAIAHLRAAGILTTEDDLDQLQWLTFVASEAVEFDLDRVMLPRTVVETHDGGGSIVLRKSPVISITSISESGTALTTSDYLVNTDAGILYRGSNYAARAFLAGFQNVVVTYRAGYLNPPRVVRKVALNAVQGMWQTSQQANHPALDEFAADAVFSATGQLTPLERAAYEALRSVGVA